MEWFTRTLHPDLMEGSFRQKIKDVYPMLYSNAPTDKQIDGILNVAMNKNSLHYDKILD